MNEFILSSWTVAALFTAVGVWLLFLLSSLGSLIFLLEETTKNLYKIETDPLGALTLIGSTDFGTGVFKLVPVA